MARSRATLSRYREARSLELALEGMGWDEIADELGYADRSGAWKAAQRGLAKRTTAAADDWLSLSFADLTILEQKLWPRAVAGDLRAAEAMIGLIDRRVRLTDRLNTLDEQQQAADEARSTRAKLRVSRPKRRPAWDESNPELGAFDLSI